MKGKQVLTSFIVLLCFGVIPVELNQGLLMSYTKGSILVVCGDYVVQGIEPGPFHANQMLHPSLWPRDFVN